MTALSGGAHDRYGTAAMLAIEALSALVWVILGLAVLARLKRRVPPTPTMTGCRQFNALPQFFPDAGWAWIGFITI